MFFCYSCHHALILLCQDIEAFPPTFVDAATELLRRQKAQAHLGNDLVVNEPGVFVHVSDKAYLHEDPENPEYVTLVNAGSFEPVDIPVATLLTYTNCIKKEQACALVEMAIASGALQLFAIQNDFWKTAIHSSLRGIPLINTDLLLQPVIPARVGEQTCFPTPHTIVVEDVTYNINIHVDQEPVAIANGLPPRSQDFVLACLQSTLERAYKIRFALAAPDGSEIPRYWVGYFDASPRKIEQAVSGLGKRPFVQVDEDDE